VKGLDFKGQKLATDVYGCIYNCSRHDDGGLFAERSKEVKIWQHSGRSIASHSEFKLVGVRVMLLQLNAKR
jgi:hypothetical protein